MNREEFFKRIGSRIAPCDTKQVVDAYYLAKLIHQKQKRDEDERYFEHCRRVALGGKTASEIILGLLHDCVEDGFPPRDFIKTIFGEEIANGVAALSKITPLYDEKTGKIVQKIKKGNEEYYAGIATSSLAIRNVKCRDRYDNISTMSIWEKERQKKYIAETEKYILPIANMTDPRLAEAIRNKCKKYIS